MRKLFDKRMKWTGCLFMLFLVASIVGLIFGGQVKASFAAEPPPIKKSRSGICHCPGGTYYGRTRNFMPFRSIEDCLASGGRHPKRGQGDCTNVSPQPDNQDKGSDKDKEDSPKSEIPKDSFRIPGEQFRTDKSQSPKLVMRVIDGDTIHLGKIKVRLHGIDAPETGQTCRNARGKTYPCGKRATSVLVLRAAAGVSCEPAGDEQDRYGRVIATCFAVDGTDINAYMVRSGHALAYRKYSQKYVSQEERARAGRRGMHRGAFVAPWDWRRGKRLQ